MAVYLPIQGLNRSSAVRIDGQKILPAVISYVDISKASVRKEVAYHSSFGQFFVAGNVSANNSDFVVDTGGLVTNGAGLTVNVSAGEFHSRSTGVYVPGLAGTNVALTAAHATLDRTDLVVWDGSTGVAAKVDGATAAAGTSVAPATPAGKVPLATVLVAATVVTPGTKTDVRPRP